MKKYQNEHLTNHQLQAINKIKENLSINTKGMDAGLEHKITVLVSSIKNTIHHLTSMYHSKRQDEHRFSILKRQAEELDGLMFESLEG